MPRQQERGELVEFYETRIAAAERRQLDAHSSSDDSTDGSDMLDLMPSPVYDYNKMICLFV